MKKSKYLEKFKDPRWQKKRLEVLENADFECCNCGENKETLHVHHLIYFKDRDPWDYPLEFLACLCEGCHKQAHNERELINNRLALVGVAQMSRVIGYLEGLIMENDPDYNPSLLCWEAVQGLDDVFRLPGGGMKGVDAILKISHQGKKKITIQDIRQIREEYYKK